MDFDFDQVDFPISDLESSVNGTAINFNLVLPSTTEKGQLPIKKASKSNSKAKQMDINISEEELYQRRKAQNRAAQRAFRDRKEGKLKELSGKLEEAEKERLKLEKELDDIKQKNMLLDMENQYLQQNKTSTYGTSITSQNTSNLSPILNIDKPEFTIEGFQQQFKFPTSTKFDFIMGALDTTSMAKHHLTKEGIKDQSLKIGSSYEVKAQRVLTLSAVWDYIMEFSQLNEDLNVDVPYIMTKLRGNEVCHGFGPAYPLEMINEIILNAINQ